MQTVPAGKRKKKKGKQALEVMGWVTALQASSRRQAQVMGWVTTFKQALEAQVMGWVTALLVGKRNKTRL